MATSGGRRNHTTLPNHVFLVFSKPLVLYTPLESLERDIFRISELLLNMHIPNLTLFNSDGYLVDLFSTKYGKCVNKPLSSLSYRRLFSFNHSYFTERQTQNSDTNRTLLYFVNRFNKELVISAYDKQTHLGQDGLLINVIDRTHSHSKLLEMTGIQISPRSGKNWVRQRSKDGKINLDYQVPSESTSTQPEIEEAMCTFGAVRLPMPDLLISLRLSLYDFFTFLFTYTLRNLMGTICPQFGRKPKMKPIMDSQLLLHALTIRFGHIFNAGMSIIHSFGPEGIQPWFLSEAEMYEQFGLDAQGISRCINLFANTVRRWGK